MTAKGELIKSILYPTPIDYLFKRHSYYFLLLMAAFGSILMVYDGYKFVRLKSFKF